MLGIKLSQLRKLDPFATSRTSTDCLLVLLAMDTLSDKAATSGAHQLKLFIEGDELYQSMLDEISSAQHSVLLESYIFTCDEIGERFINAFIERASAGIDVRVNLDAAGSKFLISRNQFQRLRKSNVTFHWFHRWSWRKPHRYNRRNHRKLLVIDRHTAFVGGFNIHRESSLDIYGTQRWRDSHVRIEGMLAEHAAQLFEHFWQGEYRWHPPSVTSQHDQLMPNNTYKHQFYFRSMLETMFNSAKQSIYLTTPYFVPDRKTQHLLQFAARKGIDVRLLVPRKNDIKIARWAAHAAYDGLLSSGVRIYEYLPRMLHSKTIIVDGNYATLGTANIDYRSFFLNYELNFFSYNSDFCQKLQELFLDDLKDSDEIFLHQWKYRFWGNKVLEFIGWLARRLL